MGQSREDGTQVSQGPGVTAVAVTPVPRGGAGSCYVCYAVTVTVKVAAKAPQSQLLHPS